MMGIKQQVQPVTGVIAMSYEFAPGKEFSFEEVRIHLSAASGTVENFVITLQSGKGSEYNVNVYSKDMNTVQDLVYQPVDPQEFEAADSLLFTWANTNSRTYGMEIIFKAAE